MTLGYLAKNDFVCTIQFCVIFLAQISSQSALDAPVLTAAFFIRRWVMVNVANLLGSLCVIGSHWVPYQKKKSALNNPTRADI